MKTKEEQIPEHSAIVRRDLFQVYESDGEVAVEGEVYERHGVRWLARIWVKNTFRRMGLGRKTMRAMINAYQHEPLWLQIGAHDGRIMDDSDLLKWYTGFGFCATGAPGILMRPAGPLTLEG